MPLGEVMLVKSLVSLHIHIFAPKKNVLVFLIHTFPEKRFASVECCVCVGEKWYLGEKRRCRVVRGSPEQHQAVRLFIQIHHIKTLGMRLKWIYGLLLFILAVQERRCRKVTVASAEC